jgi:hypothetical protein
VIKVFSRKAWRARRPRTLTADGHKRELYIHHSAGTFGGPAQSIDTAAEQAATMRAIQKFHMDERGWSDIAYHYVVFQPYGTLKLARIFEGRPVSAVPAAQLGHNSGTVAVCVVDGGKGDRLKLSTKFQLIRLARSIAASKGVTGLGGHRDAPGQSTECPGRYIYPALDEIARRAGLRRIRR